MFEIKQLTALVQQLFKLTHIKGESSPALKNHSDSIHISHLQQNHNCINVISDPCGHDTLMPQALVCFQVGPETNRDIMVQRWGIYAFCSPLRLTTCRIDGGGWLIAVQMTNDSTYADKISPAICNVQNIHTATHMLLWCRTAYCSGY